MHGADVFFCLTARRLGYLILAIAHLPLVCARSCGEARQPVDLEQYPRNSNAGLANLTKSCT